MKELPHTRSCFVCGESNPAGLKLRFETDGQIVRTRFVPGAEHVGFRQTVHGGLIASLLDEAMVWACAVQAKQFAYCAELRVRYVHSVRPQEPALVEARMTANRRGRVYEANAELRSKGGRVLATATGKYLPIQHADAATMATDFVGDPGWVFGSP
jgi:acyl-coenzyme A thioesterase PaaI-like protein